MPSQKNLNYPGSYAEDFLGRGHAPSLIDCDSFGTDGDGL